MSTQRLSEQGLDLLFRQARSQNGWRDQPVDDETLAALYDLVRWGPTSVNSSSYSQRTAVDPSPAYRNASIGVVWLRSKATMNSRHTSDTFAVTPKMIRTSGRQNRSEVNTANFAISSKLRTKGIELSSSTFSSILNYDGLTELRFRLW